ncbi:Phospholipase/carboxylesterase [Macrophomina phaseolina MS6]|uniref:Acyl-protein thioesterase 1 n=1 Tax=Macrophomina phaseolina (strain MS6) TaxID=1126212 RepID=K2RCP3_MACPH|nr:Phospholipase/carboxylesterase [Macrophomina phaseolina MS6]
MQRIFPNALDNRDAMQRTWYKPTPLSPFPSQRPELDDPEDEDGLKQSVAYMETPIDDLVANGFPPNRIVIGGYSQDCVVSLLTGLISNKYAGEVAGVAGLLGCIPLPRSDLEAKEWVRASREYRPLACILGQGQQRYACAEDIPE